MGSCKIVAIEHLSLDGVYQAPARADEDTRGDFRHGGWAMPGNDFKMQEAMGKCMGAGWSLLVGKTTYEDLYQAWPVSRPDNPMTQALTGVQKFVTSHDAGYHLPWDNSTLIAGDAVEKIAKLKQEHDKTLIIFGSGILVRSLMQQGLVDEFLLMIHPVVLGPGFRLFNEETSFSKFKLGESVTTATGVIIANYQLASV